MAWIELHQNLPAHRKVKKLKRLLKIKTPQAVGHLAMLWLWAVDNAPDGDLSALDPDDIAEACEWPKDAEQFVQALTEAGFIDPDAKLHDWSDYAGMLLDRRENQREQNRKRQQRYRNKRKADSNATESNASTQDSSPVTHDNNVSVTRYENVSNAPVTTLPNLTIPNHTKPNLNQERYEDTCKALPGTDSVTAPAPCPPQKRSEAVAYYCQHINAAPSAYALQALEHFESILGAEVTIHAIQIAQDKCIRNWRYVERILQDYERDGIRCMADIQASEQQHQVARQQQGWKKPAKAPVPEADRQPEDQAEFAARIAEQDAWMRDFLESQREEEG